VVSGQAEAHGWLMAGRRVAGCGSRTRWSPRTTPIRTSS